MNRDGSELRILIVRIGAMGDVLHALPAVAALREQMPGCFIGWAVEPRWGDLLSTRNAGSEAPLSQEKPIVDRVHGVATREWKRRPFSLATLSAIWRLRRKMRAERYDLCVDLQGSVRSSVVGRMAGAKRFVGPVEPWEWPARWLYRQRVPVTSAHVIEQACEILGAAIGMALTPAEALLPVRRSAQQWWLQFVQSLELGPDARFVVIAPTAGWGAKEWPAVRYNRLAAVLERAGYTVLVNASSAGEWIPKMVASGGVGRVVPCRLAQMTAMMRRASLVIGGDTGPVHLAAALGRPVLGLFGPTDPARTGPYGPHTLVLRNPTSQVDHRRLKETEAGLSEITVEEVTAAAFTLLEGDNVST